MRHCDLWRFWRSDKRKLIPSLYNLGSYHLLPAHFSIIGVARRPLSDDVFRDQLGKDLAELGTVVVELKREKLTAELAHRNSQNHTLRL